MVDIERTVSSESTASGTLRDTARRFHRVFRDDSTTEIVRNSCALFLLYLSIFTFLCTMAVRRSIPVYDGVFFITFTCCHWLPLFQITDSYFSVYQWFDYLKRNGHFIVGYVIMPNHFHGLIAFRNTKGKSINKIMGNCKRLLAYDIVRKLEGLNKQEILEKLGACVNASDCRKGKLHEVFEPSFDWKECRTERFLRQKLNYIHKNPCSGKWNLAERFWDYPHSSAKFYVTNEQGIYPVLNYAELQDIDLTKHYPL